MTLNSYDDIAVCNLSLDMVGAEPISSFDQNDDVAGACSRLYPMVRDSLLSKYRWNIATGKRALARATDVTPNEFSYAYKLPSNMLAGPFAVWGDGSDTPVTAYTINGDYIHCDYETVLIAYRLGADPSLWPMYLIELVATATAARLAKPVMDDATLGESLREEAFGSPQENGMGGLFRTARTVDAQTRPTRSISSQPDPLTATRY